MGTNYREKINAPVGIDKYGDIYVVSEFFKYADGFQGVTGDVVRYAIVGCGRVFRAGVEWARVFDADLLARINEWEGN